MGRPQKVISGDLHLIPKRYHYKMLRWSLLSLWVLLCMAGAQLTDNQKKSVGINSQPKNTHDIGKREASTENSQKKKANQQKQGKRKKNKKVKEIKKNGNNKSSLRKEGKKTKKVKNVQTNRKD